ncbi:hypothetical protein [Providencia rettgeri]|uniref:hypothetical protein n=1 Tax=Providencia rettgeri TaxID=587 RepID=UPI001B36CE71|nr:hypothetical protein [Providencia rettgeri]MBQ0369045.1 hypothetical protein [Providencia rettgeri]
MKKSILKAVVYTSVIVLSSIVMFKVNDSDDIVCRSSFRTISITDNVKLSLDISYTFGSYEGWVNLKGTLNSKGVESTVARKVYIDFLKIGNSMKITSTKNITLHNDNTDNSELGKYLTQAYINPGLDMDIFLYPQKNGGFIFFTNDMYSFYCK